MAANDPTEYLFATTHLVDWQHWKMLTAAEWFQPYVSRWREELELKLKANALARIMEDAKSPGRDGHSATRYLIEKGWDKDTPTHKGRPTKDQISQAAQKIATGNAQVEEHYARLVIEPGIS